MKSSEIQIGETYLFVGTESPTRQHLTGLAFTVFEKKRVWRRIRGKRANVYRFFNEFGEGARAEELEPIEKVLVCNQTDAKLNGLYFFKPGKRFPTEFYFENLVPTELGHPANIQPTDYKEKDDLPF